MSEYRTVEGATGAVDTLTGLTTFANETGVGPVKVPSDTTRLVEIWAAAAIRSDTDTDIVGIVLRLSGKGMAQGDQDFALSNGYSEGTGAQAVSFPAIVYPVDISVTPNENITVQVAAVGSDVGDANVGITLVFA